MKFSKFLINLYPKKAKQKQFFAKILRNIKKSIYKKAILKKRKTLYKCREKQKTRSTRRDTMGLICSVNANQISLKTQMNRYQSFLRQISEERQEISAEMLNYISIDGNSKDDVYYAFLENEDQQLDTEQIAIENQYALLSADYESTQKEYDSNVKDCGFSFSV